MQGVAQIHQVNPGVRKNIVTLCSPHGTQVCSENQELVCEVPETAIAVLQSKALADFFAVGNAMNARILAVACRRCVVGEGNGRANLFFGNRSREVPHRMARHRKRFKRSIKRCPVAFPRHFNLAGRFDRNAGKKRRNRTGTNFIKFKARLVVDFFVLGNHAHSFNKLRFGSSVFIRKFIQGFNQTENHFAPESQAHIRHC